MVKVIDLRENKEYEVEGGKIRDILEKLNINPELYVILKNKKIVTDQDYAEGDDVIELVPVVSGG